MNMVGINRGRRNNQKINVYIASLPRSGSTLLGMILNQVKDCTYTGESFYWKRLSPKREMCSCLKRGCDVLLHAHKKINKNKNILIISSVLPAIDKFLQESKYVENKHEDGIIKSCHGFEDEAGIFRNLFNKKVVVNSSSNIIIGEKLATKFGWKMVVIVRNPMGVIFSMMEAAKRHGQKIPKNLWVDYVADFIKRVRSLPKNDSIKIIKYEELAKDPRGIVKEICCFLGLKYSNKVLKYRNDRGHIFMANHMRLEKDETIKEDRGWIKGLSKSDKQKIIGNREIKKHYRCFGYKFKS